MTGRPSPWDRAIAALRMARDLPGYLRRPVDVAASERAIRGRLASRESTFLSLLDRSVWAAPNDPYRRLLEHAGFDRDSLRRLVGSAGIESALVTLAREGVYIRQSELKGREDIVRGGLRFRAADWEFDNPLVRPHAYLPTSGSTGRPLHVGRSLEEWHETAECIATVLSAHGLDRPAIASWQTGAHGVLRNFPSSSGLIGWFSPTASLPLATRLARFMVAAIARLARAPFGWPGVMPLSDTRQATRWLSDVRAEVTHVSVSATPSIAVRLSQTAVELGLPFDHVVWRLSGEPLTPMRAASIRTSGARVMGVFASTESGQVADSCASPATVDDLHLFSDRFAAICRTKAGPSEHGDGRLLLTSVSPTVPKVLINFEIGDHARLESRECGCALAALGWRQHISIIRNQERMTGEGMTFDHVDLARVVEHDLPARFGGTSGDFQLIERESPVGLPRVVVRASPLLGPIDESALREAVLRSLGGSTEIGRYMSRILREADAIVIERADPLVTESGKIAPFIPLFRSRDV